MRPSRSIAAVAMLLFALAGCGLFGRSPEPVVEQTAVERACRAQAAQAPAVRSLWVQSNTNSTPNEERLAAERQALENASFVDCLRREGQARPGGVEAPRER